mmetsp:Transcript_8706/g.24544  ORF Transcript_8706/g.24544 Transcript_8706/m.24544 type:complete len:215 (-) Transcript_8706:1063-1707(-)
MKQSDISTPFEKAKQIATDIEYKSLLTCGRSVLEDLAKRKSGKKINLATDDKKRILGRLSMDRMSMNRGASIRANKSGQLKRINPSGSNKSFWRRYVFSHIETLCIVLVNAGKIDSVTNAVTQIADAGIFIEFSTHRRDAWLDLKSTSPVSALGHCGSVSSASNGCVRSLLESIGSSTFFLNLSLMPASVASLLTTCTSDGSVLMGCPPDANRR